MRKLAIIAAAVAAVSSPAFAAKTQNFAVKVKITGTCNVDLPADISFPDAETVVSAVSATTTVTVQCSNGLAYTLSLDASSDMVGSVGSDTIPYSLTFASSTGTGAGMATDIDHVLTAAFTADSAPTVADYTDTRTVTVSY